MALFHSPSIVTNGLILCLDPGNVKCYPGSGSTLTNLVGSGFNGTISGTVSVSTTQPRHLFASAGNFIDIPINLGGATPHTIFSVAGYNGSTRGRITSTNSNNWLLGHWSNSVSNFFSEGWVTGTGVGGSDTNWRIYACTGNQSSDIWQYYENGALVVSNNGGSNGPTSIRIGGIGSGETSDWKWAMLLAYNRVLSASEIQQNFNALRGRFGI